MAGWFGGAGEVIAIAHDNVEANKRVGAELQEHRKLCCLDVLWKAWRWCTQPKAPEGELPAAKEKRERALRDRELTELPAAKLRKLAGKVGVFSSLGLEADPEIALETKHKIISMAGGEEQSPLVSRPKDIATQKDELPELRKRERLFQKGTGRFIFDLCTQELDTQEGADAEGSAQEGQQLEGATMAHVLGHGLFADPSLFGVRLLDIDPDTASGLLTLAALDAQANGPVYLG